MHMRPILLPPEKDLFFKSDGADPQLVPSFITFVMHCLGSTEGAFFAFLPNSVMTWQGAQMLDK